MVLATLLGQTCQIFRPTKILNSFQDQKDSWSTTPTQTVRCRLQQLSGTEDVDGRDLANAQWRLYLPPDVAISEHDRVRVDGKDFEVVSVYPVNSPRAGVHHLELTVASFSGGVAS